MEHTYNKPRFTRLASLLLALVMVLSMFPVTAFAADGSYVKITDKDGNDAYRFAYGEPIMVTAAAGAGDWVGLYDDYYDTSRTSSWYWYYTNAAAGTDGQAFTSVNGGTYNMYNGVCYDSGKANEYVPAGVYFVETGNKDARQMVVVGNQIMQLEKNEFKYGEPIKVTVPESVGLHSDAWIGIYTKEYNTTKNSCYWNYVSSLNAGASLFDRGVNDEGDLFLPGEYVLVFSNDTNYNVLDIVEITITDEFVEDLIVKTEATCDAPGKIEYLNFATKAPIADLTETLPQKNHAYDNSKWVYDAATKTHAHVCANDSTHKADTAGCSFGEGVVVTEAVGPNAGTKKFTCSICGGSYTEEYYLDKYPTGETKVNKAATCEEPGEKLIYWSDGTTTTEPIPALNHDYTGEYVFSAETKQHQRKCVNDATHLTAPADCDFEFVVNKDTTTYTCKVCKGTYEGPTLSVDKMEYAWKEPIMVTSMAGDPCWVGLYKQDDTNIKEGGTVSLFWLYATPGAPVNLLTGTSQRAGEYVSGTYKVLLLAADYTVVASVENITVTAEIDESKTVRVEPTCTKDGSITYTYIDDTTKVITAEEDNSLKALTHDYSDFAPTYTVGETVGSKDNAEKYTHKHACTRENCDKGEKWEETASCTWDAGVADGLKITYTCTECDGTVIVDTSKQEESRETFEPTCTQPGYTLITYKDGSTEEIDPTPALEHDFDGVEFSHVEGTNTHTRSCKRADCDKGEGYVQTEECSPSNTQIKGEENKIVFICGCGNTWSEKLLNLVDGEDKQYKVNEMVKLSVNKNYPHDKKSQWVGLYKKADNLDLKGYLNYMYILGEGDGLPYPGYIFDVSGLHDGTDRGFEYGPGVYTIVLFGDAGYDMVVATVDFTVHGCVDTETKDHLCDICGDPMGVACNDGNNDHKCDHCGEKISSCSDKENDGDHKCDTCGNLMDGYVCKDSDNNHKCDECAKVLSECADTNKNHKCDICDGNVGKHEDTNKDHTCDYGCDVIIGKCVDNNKDHKCDHGCSETFGVCEDKNGDGKCDYGCDKKYETDPTEPDPTEPDPTEPDDKDEPKVEGVERVAGNDRFQTAVEVADQMKEVLGVEKFNTIIVASGATYADALPGSYLAIVKNAPILLGHSKVKYNALAQDYIKANLAEGGTVYILGGEAAVPASFETALEGIKVVRLAGKNRFETNMLILKEAGVKEGDEIMICTGADYADALSASAAGKPILLVHKKLYDYQVEFLKGLKGNTFCVIGGEAAVKPEIETAVSAYGKTERLAGKDRMLTSHMVAERYFDGADTAVVAFGWNFPDGLCGGPLANALKSPLILTHTKEKLYNITAEFTKGADIKAGLVLGGTTLIPEAAVNAIYGTTPVALG